MVTFDSDFLGEAARRQAEGIDLAGVIYARLLRISVSESIHDLELIAKALQIPHHGLKCTRLQCAQPGELSVSGAPRYNHGTHYD